MATTVCVVGAGLSGSMVALLLAQRGLVVTMLEKRSAQGAAPADPGVPDATAFVCNPSRRTINMALSHRGIEALARCSGLIDRLAPLLIPMVGRAIHPLHQAMIMQPYGDGHQAIYSVSRGSLNAFLLAELVNAKVEIAFGASVVLVSPAGEVVYVEDGGQVERTRQFDMVIAADGAFSSVRDSLSKCFRIDVSKTFLGTGYKEFTMHAKTSIDGQLGFALPSPHCLHVWPRHRRGMIVALPNPDFSFTCTLFVPWEGEGGFASLDQLSDAELRSYFGEMFAELPSLIPDLVEQYKENVASPLVTAKCKPWNVGRVVLIGDAAHAVVPFLGQGMNAAFEDALQFTEIWEETCGDVQKTIELFSSRRQPSADALADLSIENYVDMSSSTDSIFCRTKKRIDQFLHGLIPSYWIPLYTMVAFTRIPYDEARNVSKRQDRMLLTLLCSMFALIAGLCAHISTMG